MRLSRFLVLAIGFSATPALGVEVVTYAGKVGGAEVVLELALSPEGVPQAGRYAKLAKGVDVPLHATAGTAALGTGPTRLREEKPCTVQLCGDPNGDAGIRPAFGAEWELEADGENVTLSGMRRDRGQTAAVTLFRKGTRTLPEDAEITPGALDPYATLYAGIGTVLTPDRFPYDFLKQDIPFTRGPEMTLGEGTFRIDEDPRVKLPYPVVTRLSGGDPARLNEGLAALRLQHSLSAWSCLSSAFYGFGWSNIEQQGLSGYEEGGANVVVDHLSPRLMSLTESGSFWCGGPHPWNYSDHRVLDARTGEPIVPEQLLGGWREVGRDGNPVDPATYDNSDGTLEQGPTDELAAFVRERRERFDQELEDDCFYDGLVASNLAVTVKGPNLLFTLAGLPHVSFACTQDLLSIPLKDARPLLTEKGARYFSALDR